MKIDSTSASDLPKLTKTRQQARQVQNVFSEVLVAAGWQGYASAQEVEGS